MDSTDKIKILLEDFREKEALNREEIGEIEKQIGELEQLVEASKERMERVNADKEKVYMMRNRYAEGDWSDVLAKASEKIKSESSTAKSDSDTNGGVSTVSTETIDVPVVKAKVDTDSQNTEANLFEPSSAPSLPESVPIPTPYKEPVNQELSSSPGSVAIPTPPDEANTGFQEPVQEVNLPGGYIPGLSASDHDVLPVALDNPDKPPILPGIPNPPTGFDAMQVPPGLPNMAMPKAQGPVEETKESSLFPFNQGPEMSSDLDQDSPWSGMTWESSGNSEQVEEIQTANVPPQQPQQVQPIQQVQPLQQIQTPQAPPAPPAPMAPALPPQMQPQMQSPSPPNGFNQAPQPPNQSPVPPQQQAVLMQSQMNLPLPEPVDPNQDGSHQAFDISDALKPEYDEDDDEPPKDDENVKKINDALRGLFS